MIEAAKNLLKKALRESISEYQENPESQLSKDGGHSMYRENEEECLSEIDEDEDVMMSSKEKSKARLRKQSSKSRKVWKTILYMNQHL